MQHLTPKQIVAELDRYIVGQHAAKRAVAIAIRNRWRRQQLDPDFGNEVSPKNIVMSGPTGVGKTEIARRIAGLTGAPFIKVEASKFTEVGYHGRDVESMVRDLLEQAIQMVRDEHAERVRDNADAAVEERLLDLLLPDAEPVHAGRVASDDSIERRQSTRERLRTLLREGKFEDREVEITVQRPAVPVAMFSNMGLDQMDPEMSRMFESIIPEQSSTSRLKVSDAREVLLNQETDARVDREKITLEAIHRTEQTGIIFLDEIDKVAVSASSGGRTGGPDVSREGVQRDLLPIVEGSTVTTRHGTVRTDHVLFIAAGAFHAASVSDLMPELQGRFPIRVELDPLTKDDFVRILKEPHNALTRQQAALLATEGIEVSFEDDALDALARIAADVNARSENIGARRLMTVIEKLFEEVNFDAPDLAAQGHTQLTVTAALVHDRLGDIAKDEDLSKFVL